MLTVKKKREHKEKPKRVGVKVAAYLSYCDLTGYEIWANKPRFESDLKYPSFNAVDWSNGSNGNFYYRLNGLEAAMMKHGMQLSHGQTRSIWLHVGIAPRKGNTHAEEMQASQDEDR